MMKNIWIVLLIIFTACEKPVYDTAEEDVDPAQAIVDEAIEVAGGEKFKHTKIAFDFREHHYERMVKDAEFAYSRIKVDSLGETLDMLDNSGFKRLINEKEVDVIDTMAAKYSRSVNSVIYFAFLPYRLNDASVNKEYIGQKKIKGELYNKIRVTFDQEGGGEDYDDEFIYWISEDDKTVDYLAYEYHTDGGGIRFREAKNPRKVEGIRLVDYNNYKPTTPVSDIKDLDILFEKGELEKLSEINLENPTVAVVD